jgi:hypothetical protein
MHALTYFFHEHLTFLRCATVYLLFIAVILGVTLPIVGVGKKAQKDNHVDEASRLADALAYDMSFKINAAMEGVRDAQGFAAAGAPLIAPPYFSNLTASQRVAIAIQSSNPEAYNNVSYSRLLARVAAKVPGLYTAAVQPGIVNYFSATTSAAVGLDFLDPSQIGLDTIRVYQFLVTRGLDYLALVPWVGNSSYLIIRAPVWNNTNISKDPNALDERGNHVNWRYCWGAVSIVIDLRGLARKTNFSAITGKTYDYLFEALPRYQMDNWSTYQAYAYTASSVSAFDSAPRSCLTRALFDTVCFRVRPKGAWRGDDGTLILVIVGVVIAFAPAILLVAAITLIRIIVGPKPDALVEVPRQAPFHAVCIDMPKSNKMYVEVPFVLMEVTTTFNAEMERLCIRHDVHVAQRLGHTIIVVSAYRSRIVNFTLAMSEWCYTHKWPTHIALHNRHGCVDFSFIMHTCQTATIAVDPATGDINIAGPDVQALLLLRVAAVPRHVICTNQFLGIGNGARFDESASFASPTSVTSDDFDTTGLSQTVREIGVCHLRINSEKRPFITLQGYLVPSAATAKKASLADVTGAFPEWLLQEWHVSRTDRSHSSVRSGNAGNPLRSIPVDEPTTKRGGSRVGVQQIPSSSSVLDVIATIRGPMPASVYANAEASESLPGSAVDITEARRLALALASMTQSTWRSVDDRHSAPVMFSANVQRLRQSLSLATYCFLAYRILLSPLDMENRLAIVNIWTNTLGLPSETFKYALAARCARVAEYLEFERLEKQRRLMRAENEAV